MGVTSQTNAVQEHFAGSSYIPIASAPEDERDSEALLMYPYAGDDDALLTKYTDTSDIYSFGESTPRLTNLPSGYLSISSFVKSVSNEIEKQQHHNFAAPSYESDFWSPPLSFFSNNNEKRRRKISIAQDAFSVLVNQRDENHNDVDNSSGDKNEDDGKLSPSILSELMPSFPNVSLPKLPERSWFCNTCRKPKDECNCMCVIC